MNALNVSLIAIPLLPLLAMLWIGLAVVLGKNQGDAGEKQTSRIAIGSMMLSAWAILYLDYLSFTQGFPATVQIGSWLESGAYQIHLNFLIDGLSLTLLNLNAVIILLVLWFSVNYLHREPGFQRFFMVFCLFSSGIQLIVMAGNAALLFIGWEFAGLSSYLLIGYRWQRDVATQNALRAFITNRLGDAGLIFALFFSFLWWGSTEWQVLFADKGESTLHIALISSGFVLAALIKSAQFPFSAWITRALEGPTPSSAIFYGALMVHAGIYLLLRLEPLIAQAETLQIALILIGVLSIAYGYFAGLVQTDVKTAFIFSSIAQLGIMVVSIGLGWFEFATLHLCIHAVWRTYQFLHAPSFLHQVTNSPRPAAQWLQKRPALYIAAVQRFWLDSLGDHLLVKPFQKLAQDARLFEEQVIIRISGNPSSSHLLSRLNAGKEGLKQEYHSNDMGLLGRFMHMLGDLFEWIEQKLVMSDTQQRLQHNFKYIGDILENIERRLAEPRYLMLIIVVSFVMVL